jgi:general stress protein 26
MSEIKNLTQQEAMAKLKELAEKIDFCLFCTSLAKTPCNSRPMSTRAVDEEGNIWFFSRESSNKNQDIASDYRVQLMYARPGNSEFLTVYGRAEILKDRAKTEELWSNFAKAWFNDGKDDPELTLIKVIPEDVHYWDTKDGKMISLVKIGVSALLNKELDSGVEGDLQV